MKVVLTRGLPSSGKSTYAKELLKTGNWTRVNKDDLRLLLHGGKWSRENEKQVETARDALVIAALNVGKNVIIDDTNLHPKHEARIRQLVREWYAERGAPGQRPDVSVEIKDFTDVSVEECIRRDSKRVNYVGERVIRRMYNQFLRKIEKPVLLPDAETVVICDLDGTLCLFGDANPYDRDFSKDKVNVAVLSVLRSVLEHYGHRIILLSGRNGKYKEATEKWLHDNDVRYNELHMRDESDVRKDSIVKREMYDNYIRGKYNVAFVMDDRNQVVELWRDLGLVCMQVAEGDF
jgi:predicted kinase